MDLSFMAAQVTPSPACGLALLLVPSAPGGAGPGGGASRGSASRSFVQRRASPPGARAPDGELGPRGWAGRAPRPHWAPCSRAAKGLGSARGPLPVRPPPPPPPAVPRGQGWGGGDPGTPRGQAAQMCASGASNLALPQSACGHRPHLLFSALSAAGKPLGDPPGAARSHGFVCWFCAEPVAIRAHATLTLP